MGNILLYETEDMNNNMKSTEDKMLQSMKFKTKLISGNGIVLFLMAIVAIVLYSSIISLNQTTIWVNHTHDVIASGNELVAAMVDQETGMRGYLVGGLEEFLEPYNNGKRNFERVIAALKKKVSDNPAQVTRLEKIEDLAKDWDQKAAKPQIELREKVNAGDEASRNFKNIMGSVVGKQIFDSFRAEQRKLENRFKRVGNAQGINLAQSILMDMINQETGQRGFLLTGKDESLQPYHDGKNEFDKHLSELRNLQGSGVAERDIAAIEELARQWREKAAELEIEARKEMNTVGATIDELVAMVGQKKGKIYMDQLRGKVAEFIDIEEELMNQRQKGADAAVGRGKFFASFGTLFAILVGIGVIYLIIRSLLDQLGGEPALVTEMANKIAEGKLTMKVEIGKTGLLGAMFDMVKKLKQIVTEVKMAAGNVASGSEELSSTSEMLSQGAIQQSASTEEVSSSMEQMSANIQQNTDNAQQTESIAGKSAKDALESGDSVKKAVEAMKQIAEKIGIIQRIATKTDVLAINAAIEAANVGDQGKRFAVVAGEIRELAEKSQKAADEITELASSSVQVAEIAGKKLEELVPDIQKTADLVQEISAASREMNAGTGQINKAIQQVDQANQANASSSEQMASTASELAAQAAQLMSTISFFRTDDEGSLSPGIIPAPVVTEAPPSPAIPHPPQKAVSGGGVQIKLGDEQDEDFEQF